VGGHHYGAYQGAVDDYCWAAVELWLTTGEQKYHDFFLKHFVPKTAWNWGWWPLEETAGLCTRAYAFGTRTDKDPEMLKACIDGGWGVLDAARKTKSWQDGWATRVSFAEDPWRFGRWGWYFLSDVSSYDLALGATLVPEPERTAFLQAAAFNADQEFGNSADDVVSMTGIGIKRPIDHVHQISRFSGLVEPVPGVPMGFHPAGYNRGNTARPIMSSFMVRELPAAYRYADCWNVEQEFTVQVLGPAIMTYAMMADPAAQRAGRPELAITANGRSGSVTGNAPFRVEFAAQARGANGKAIRDYYWDLSDEEVAADPAFTYTFAVPGLYPVVCSVTDEDGWMSYRTVMVCVAQPPAQRPNAGRLVPPAAGTYALWNFDNGLQDAANGLAAELVGGAQLSTENMLWMNQPTGHVVRVRAPADGVRIRLPDLLLNDPAFREVRIEALVNYQADVGSGRGHSKMFVLYCNHDTIFGLQKDTWAGKSFWGVAAEQAKDPTFEKSWRAITEPQPGWMKLAMGFNRDTGKGYLETGRGRIEFPYHTGPSRNANVLEVGGFVGSLDEIRILARRSETAPAP
jgi:PKD repeat protein